MWLHLIILLWTFGNVTGQKIDWDKIWSCCLRIYNADLYSWKHILQGCSDPGLYLLLNFSLRFAYLHSKKAFGSITEYLWRCKQTNSYKHTIICWFHPAAWLTGYNWGCSKRQRPWSTGLIKIRDLFCYLTLCFIFKRSTKIKVGLKVLNCDLGNLDRKECRPDIDSSWCWARRNKTPPRDTRSRAWIS